MSSKLAYPQDFPKIFHNNTNYLGKNDYLCTAFCVTDDRKKSSLVMLRGMTTEFLITKTMDLIKVAEQAFATNVAENAKASGKKFDEFHPGDTITVAYKIIEGNKERIQLYRGVVIRISGHGLKKRFTVRKMSGTVGVERIFPIESPNIDSIEVNKHGKVRRAKLYYLRKLTGKKARIKEKWSAPKAQS